MGRLFTILLATAMLSACANQGGYPSTGIPDSRGKYVGNTFVSASGGYAFRVPPGWKPADRQMLKRLAKDDPRSAALDFADFLLVGPDNGSLIFGASSRFPVPKLRSLGGDRTIIGEEKKEWLRLVWPLVDPKWYGDVTVRVATFGAHSFLMTYRRPLVTVGDFAAAAEPNGPPGGDGAAFANGDYSYSFVAQVRSLSMRRAFEQLLATIEFR